MHCVGRFFGKVRIQFFREVQHHGKDGICASMFDTMVQYRSLLK